MGSKELAKVFNYGTSEVRTIIKDGEPWFIVKDICEILAISNHKDALSRLSKQMKGVATTDTLGGKQSMSVVSEAGVYKLVFTSRKPEAEKFTDWLAIEVIPSIRKHGAYMTSETIEKTLADPDFIINLATQLKNETEARIQKELENKRLTKSVVYQVKIIEKQQQEIESLEDVIDLQNNSFEAFFGTEGLFDFKQASKIMSNGLKEVFGSRTLFKWLKELGYIMKDDSPYQKSIDAGYIMYKVTIKEDAEGKVKVTQQPFLTARGLDYTRKRLIQAGYIEER